MPNYSNSVIYKIVCNDKSVHDMYIGSTCSFISRKGQHKSACNNANSKIYNRKVYKCIRGLGGWDAWSMLPILQYPCESKMALCIKEREIMENHNATLNSLSAYNTEEETIEKLKISKKKWDNANAGKIKISNKKWNDANPDYMKKYNEDNAKKIKKRKSEKITCECGCEVTRSSIARHRKSTKHFTLMESVVNQI